MSKEDMKQRDSKQLKDIKLSILDLAPIVTGGTPADSFHNTLNLAQHVEKLGFHRFWLAEHHNMPGIASSATSVLIGYVASGTSTIRVGSGGIMLPNHAPLIVAEQFGTLESLYPGRIDLGLGRAPGTDQAAVRALRRDIRGDHDFPQDLEELRSFFKSSPEAHPTVRAVPGEGLNIPIWLLGSSGFSAQLAGQLGLPFAFASHFSPDNTLAALELYRKCFKPSEVLQEPYVMVGVNVIAADTDKEALRLATSHQQRLLKRIRGYSTPLDRPVESMDEIWSAYEKGVVEQQLRSSINGSVEVVKEKLQAFLDETQADEMMINTSVYDHEARLRSYTILANLWKG
ncbi:LLM class flavin-dependent oxidoreductase [Alkalihalobacillus deserti]|uniref:LLM class flavin-dependent oxidoreductase n=1 Tax=Alkalihalobacillus deserti TaxID=2879466 RepID=UPI001D143826|nr:LLM class flavin-dependent oxidoreductase [Alkalihalobacillus deserti]